MFAGLRAYVFARLVFGQRRAIRTIGTHRIPNIYNCEHARG